MKKKLLRCFHRKETLKVWRIMRLLTIFSFCFAMTVSASIYSQNTKLNLDLKNVTLREVLDYVEQNSDFIFLYKNEEVDIDKKMDVNLQNASIDEIMRELLADQNVTYKVLGRQVIITIPEKDRLDLATGQSVVNIKGKVTDSSGSPLTGVTVVIKGTTQGIITDADGKYSLANVPGDATLVFSFVGMKMQEVLVVGKTSINVTMEEETVGIEEVVAVGYGTQKRVNLTGSVASVQSEDLVVAPVASTTNALAGRLPGLISKQSSGMPGNDDASLSIRGYGDPLVIVDGIESSFNNIDANEIESISVLKDASAAIYGSRAGNGVILVTTKRGNIDKPTITLNSNWTFQGVTNMPKLASSGQWTEMDREEDLNSGVTPTYSEAEIALYYAGTDPDYSNTNWWKIVAKDWAPQQQHNLSVRGGSDKIKYYGFLGFLDQRTMFKKHGGDYQRYNLRSNIDAKILDNLKLQLDFAGIIEDKDFPQRGLNGNVWQEYWMSMPMYAASLPDGRLAWAGCMGLNYVTNSKLSGYTKNDDNNFKGTISLNYDFKQIQGLSAKAFLNYDQSFDYYKNFGRTSVDSWTYNYGTGTYTQRTSATKPELSHTDSKSRVLTGQYSLNFDRTFAENHHISALALFEVINSNSDWISASRKGYTITSLDYLFAGALSGLSNYGSASEMGRRSLVSRVNYSYKSKYLLEGTLRIDESAKFNKENRRGYFPGISLGWRLSEEDFIKNNIPSLENLKLRISYSQTGNDNVSSFAYLSGYKYGLNYLIGSTTTQALVTTGMANPTLTWEEMNIYNLGLDFSLVKRKLYGEFDFFYRDRNGIPGSRVNSLPDTFGSSLPTENLNSITTRGFELMLGMKDTVMI